jgi:sulfonate transport system substrate-binding protein
MPGVVCSATPSDRAPLHTQWRSAEGGKTMGRPSKFTALTVFAGLIGALAFGAEPAAAQGTPTVDMVIGNNFGHLPMFVGVEKGFFRKHGVDVRLKVVNTGTDMVNAMQKREVQIGDMSVTTFLKARHSGEPFRVIGIIMNDATRDNADEPLAIVARKDSGIKAVADLRGRRVGLAKAQTSDEYFKMVLARHNMKYDGDVAIENIMAPPALAPALKEGKVDAVVSWEPYNTAVLEQVAESYVVLRGGGYLSYIMVATAHEPTIADSPQLIRGVVAGLAAASQYTRKNRDEAVEIFAKLVPNTDLPVAKKAVRHISYDPRLSPAVLKAFDAAEDDILKNTLQGAQRLNVAEQFSAAFLAEVEKAHPEYFDDLPPLKARSN